MKRALIIIAIVFIAGHINAQQTWIETEISKEIVNDLDLSISPQIRFKDGFDVNKYFFDANLDYKLSKYLSVGAGYRLGNNLKKSGDAELFGRYKIEIKTSYKWNKFEPKFRLRYTNDEDFGDDDNDPVKNLRYKLELEYNIKKIKSRPYILYELYHDLDEHEINKARLETGFLFKLNKKNRIGAYYRLNNYLKSNKESANIFGIIYKLKL